MPSPVAHLLSGAAVYLAGTTRERRSSALLAVALAGSVAPDLDFLPGIMIGDMRAFHHGISHSLVSSLVYGAVMLLLGWQIDRVVAVRVAMLATLAYASHVILDFVSVNPGTRGVPLLWPLSTAEFGVRLNLFGHFRYSDISEGIWSVVRWENVVPLLREVGVLGALVLILRHKEQIRQRVLGLLTRISRRYP